MMTANMPAPSCSVVAFQGGVDPQICVLAKRTYDIRPGRPCRVSQQQVALGGRQSYTCEGQGGKSPMRADDDLMCKVKRGTDLVVQGQAHSLKGPVPRMTVSVSVKAGDGGLVLARELLVLGDRQLVLSGDDFSFGEPEPFETMPVRYDRAYGGLDVWSERLQADEDLPSMARSLDLHRSALSRYLYPRNPAGQGYLVHRNREALAEVQLPNIEDPKDRLTPERLLVADQLRWPGAPVPAGFDWVDQYWYPRCALLGMSPKYTGEPEDLWEVKAGVLPAAVALPDARHMLELRHLDRYAHGASPHLIRPTWTGGETVIIRGMHPEVRELVLPLPGPQPELFLETPRGDRVELEPSLRTVLVSLDEQRLVLVWVGRHPYHGVLVDELLDKTRHAVKWPRE